MQVHCGFNIYAGFNKQLLGDRPKKWKKNFDSTVKDQCHNLHIRPITIFYKLFIQITAVQNEYKVILISINSKIAVSILQT